MPAVTIKNDIVFSCTASVTYVFDKDDLTEIEIKLVGVEKG